MAPRCALAQLSRGFIVILVLFSVTCLGAHASAAFPPSVNPDGDPELVRLGERGTATLSAVNEEPTSCPDYARFASKWHAPGSSGAYNLSYMRPAEACRTLKSDEVELAIDRLRTRIIDPDVMRLFENSLPNTLDTMVSWRGAASNNSEEELAYLITGDINAMWLRDSAAQLSSYKTILMGLKNKLSSTFRGVINLQARYIVLEPYCNAFLPPTEAGMEASRNYAPYKVTPQYDLNLVWTCNFKLDSLASFLMLSYDYHLATHDTAFFGNFQWLYAVQSILRVSRELQKGTYTADGEWYRYEYTFQSQTYTAAGTLGNGGFTNPVNYTGLIRSPFRPSDDAVIYDFHIPANMMMAVYLERTADIVAQLPTSEKKPETLEQELRDLAAEVRAAIEHWGIVTGPNGKKMYAYEVDGYGGRNLMDDANVPSLLAAPLLDYVNKTNPVYVATRDFVLSRRNPWWASGRVLSAVGSGHIKPNAAWPMASMVRGMTALMEPVEPFEVIEAVRQVLTSTDGLGLIHESVNSANQADFTRPWFGWVNGLFGQLILMTEQYAPELLEKLSKNPEI